jgi:hypothetical protein
MGQGSGPCLEVHLHAEGDDLLQGPEKEQRGCYLPNLYLLEMTELGSLGQIKGAGFS